ncbi:MAG TPA: hypothetical protein VFV83_10490, partial [Chthoniobacteraceae bacterium]|nr:hypothetical protein [Chthoniobacteraceae bacterium]
APRVVVANTTRRDAVIAAIMGVMALGVIGYGFVQFAKMSHRAKRSTLTGIVVEKQLTPAPEQQITVGRSGLKEERIEGEYVLKVRVDAEAGRIFEVPVERKLFNEKKVGDSLMFLRPPSERQ